MPDYLNPELVNFNANVHAGVVGRTRSGKTMRLIERANHCEYLVAFDTQGDFYNPDAPLYMKNVAMVEKPSDIIRSFRQGNRRILYRPPTDHIKYFDQCCRVIYPLGTVLFGFNRDISLTFAVDEIWIYANKDTITFPLKKIIRAGLKKNIRLLFTVQRLADCHADATTQCNQMFIYNSWAQDINYLHRMIPEVNDTNMKSLRQYECLYFDGDTNSLWKLPAVEL